MLGLLTEIPRRFLCCAAAAAAAVAVARDSQVRQVVQQATQLVRAVCNPRQPPLFWHPFALIRLRTGRAVLFLRAEVIVTAGAERVAISCCRSPYLPDQLPEFLLPRRLQSEHKDRADVIDATRGARTESWESS